MYKSRLQELCQKKAWPLPHYATVRDGPAHNPSFHTTVTVNGSPFQSPSYTRSSRESQNAAAQIAFFHLSAPVLVPAPASSSSTSTSAAPPPTPLPPSLDHGSSILTPELNCNAVNNGSTVQPMVCETNKNTQGNKNSTKIVKNIDRNGGSHLCKNKLQMYCQKRSILLPEYHCEREGPSHASRFKCAVTVDGKTYETHEFFNTLKEAEAAAAKIALMSIAPDEDEEDHSSYKNLLQEWTQKEAYNLPTYETIRTGQSHSPIFISTVNVEGELFTGPEAKTKKQAEFGAAKVTYMTLKQRNSTTNERQEIPHSPFPNMQSDGQNFVYPSQGQKNRQFASSSSNETIVAYLNHRLQPQIFAPNDQAEENRDPPVVSTVTRSSSTVNMVPPSSMISLPEQCLPSSASTFDSSMVVLASIEQMKKLNSPCQNRVIVHSQQIKVPYPAGSSVEISDDDWVAVKIRRTEQSN